MPKKKQRNGSHHSPIAVRDYILALLVVCGNAQSQQPPQRPQIETKQHTNGSTDSKQDASEEKQSGSNLAAVVQKVSSLNAHIESKGDGEQGSDQGTEFWPPLYGYRLKVTDTLLVVVTLLLFFATVGLYVATRRLVKDAKDTSKRQLRAYVWMDAKAGPDESQQGFHFKFEIHNSGATPAYSVRCWCRMRVLNPLDITRYEFEKAPVEIEKPRFVINPGSVHFHGTGTKATKQEKLAVSSGDKRVYLWGEIRYIDAFKEPHTTEFRSFWRESPGGSMWAYCDDGNEAD